MSNVTEPASGAQRHNYLTPAQARQPLLAFGAAAGIDSVQCPTNPVRFNPSTAPQPACLTSLIHRFTLFALRPRQRRLYCVHAGQKVRSDI